MAYGFGGKRNLVSAMADEMNAVRLERYGGAEVLVPVRVPRPSPKAGEVLIAPDFAGVNFADVYVRNGVYAKSPTYSAELPLIPGFETGGRVAGLGEGVEGFALGERVVYNGRWQGGYAEFQAVPAWRVAKVPDGLPLDVATAIMLQGLTAHYLTHSAFDLGRGHWCLVHAGAGGVGQLLIQIAKRRGARVVAAVGSAEKAAVAAARGADRVVIGGGDAVVAGVAEATAGAGVDVVYDSVGQATFAASLKSLRRRGLCVLFGAASGAVDSVDPMILAEAGSVFLTRPHLAHYTATPEEFRGRLADLFGWLGDGSLSVAIDRRLPLAAAADAHRALEGRATKGKILLTVR